MIMKKTTLNNIMIAASLAGTLSYAGAAYSLTKDGTLGNAASATDSYKVTCSSNANGATDHINVSIRDQAPIKAPIISVQVLKALLAANATDQVDGNTAYSPIIGLKGGNGIYTVRVNKTNTGSELYRLSYNCLSAANKSTGIAISIIQDQ